MIFAMLEMYQSVDQIQGCLHNFSTLKIPLNTILCPKMAPEVSIPQFSHLESTNIDDKWYGDPIQIKRRVQRGHIF